MIIISINKDKLLKEALKFSEINTEELFKNGIKNYLLQINKKNIFRKLIFLFIEICLTYIIVKQKNTLSIINTLVNISLTTNLTLLGIVFTGYIFFQALLNDRLLIALLQDNSSKKTNCLRSMSIL